MYPAFASHTYLYIVLHTPWIDAVSSSPSQLMVILELPEWDLLAYLQSQRGAAA